MDYLTKQIHIETKQNQACIKQIFHSLLVVVY